MDAQIKIMELTRDKEYWKSEYLKLDKEQNRLWKIYIKLKCDITSDLAEILNNLDDDLQMDKTGDSGYKTYKEVVKAIKKYTYKVAIRKYKKYGGVIE